MRATQERPPHVCTCGMCTTASDTPVKEQHRQINLLLSRLSEPQRRWYVATLSQQIAGPTDMQLSIITGMDEKTIRRGRRELRRGLPDLPPYHQRRPGGGRPRREKKTQL